MVPAGSTILFTVQGTTDLSFPFIGDAANAIRSSVLNTLSANFNVLNVNVIVPTVLSDILNSYIYNFPYTATVQFVTRGDYGAIADLDSVVANAFYEVVGSVPTVNANGYGDVATLPPTGTSGVTPTNVLVFAGIAVVLVLALKLT